MLTKSVKYQTLPLWLFTFTFTLQIINLSSRPSKYHIPPIKHSIENLAAKIGICSYFRNATLDHKDVKMPEPQHVSQEGLAYAGTTSCCCSFSVDHICHSHIFYLNFRPRNVMPTICNLKSFNNYWTAGQKLCK